MLTVNNAEYFYCLLFALHTVDFLFQIILLFLLLVSWMLYEMSTV